MDSFTPFIAEIAESASLSEEDMSSPIQIIISVMLLMRRLPLSVDSACCVAPSASCDIDCVTLKETSLISAEDCFISLEA